MLTIMEHLISYTLACRSLWSLLNKLFVGTLVYKNSNYGGKRTKHIGTTTASALYGPGDIFNENRRP